MPVQDIEFHNPRHRDIFHYLSDQLPQYGYLYYSPDISPKGIIEIYYVSNVRIVTVTLESSGDFNYSFTALFGKRGRQEIIDTINNCPKDYFNSKNNK